ncbi:hypothetical protein [Bacillus sp. 165]|uniref:hypothetical protein n=1 Tax=Bacillus sp. 165 TaxID=1529117 RepID=UPI001ADC71A0|nr:hypothetical protein [Bacillus sp. 165]MBO9130808.1 hypothetical protein [Bacillus sp. 165]
MIGIQIKDGNVMIEAEKVRELLSLLKYGTYLTKYAELNAKEEINKAIDGTHHLSDIFEEKEDALKFYRKLHKKTAKRLMQFETFTEEIESLFIMKSSD